MMWYVLGGIALLAGFMVFTGAPYVPSMPKEVRRAFTKLYHLGADDVLVDIGSGDGLVLRIARSYGARTVGYEINPILVGVAKLLSRRDKGVAVYLANFWRRALPDDVTLVYTFGDGRDIKKMYDKVVAEATRLDRDIWFVSYGFKVSNVKPAREVGAHILYRCEPLRDA